MCNTIRQEPKDAGVFISLTKVAEENSAESLLIIHDKRLVSLYTMNWQEHALHSEVYAGRGFNRVPIEGNKAILDRGEVMKIIEEIKETLRMEIRPNSKEPEYLEAVIDKKDLGLLKSLLKKHLGPAAKKPGKEANLPMEIQKMVDSLGGLRVEQSFFYRQDGNRAIYVALWPWESNPNRITLKSGVRELVSTDL